VPAVAVGELEMQNAALYDLQRRVTPDSSCTSRMAEASAVSPGSSFAARASDFARAEAAFVQESGWRLLDD